jgi:phospholipid transport system substrate-binding protein
VFKTLIKQVLAIATLVLFLANSAVGVAMNPDQLVESTINELIGELETRRGELEQDKDELYRMVEEVVVPHFDLLVIARLVLARHWRSATEQQRVEFAEQFKRLLIRTYATALFEYTGNEKMEVRPFRHKEGERRARVETRVTLPDAQPVQVNYSFLLTDSDEWKIYDVEIEGISLVTNYRSSYSQIIQDKGLDSLIEELARKNLNPGSA